MKKIICSLLLFLPILNFAENIPENKARQVAETFFGVTNKTKSGSSRINLIWNGESSATKGTGSVPAFYVYSHSGGGFVIVAGDDVISPILAYSYTNNFRTDGMPGHVHEWFDSIRSAINLARATGVNASGKTVQAWQTYLDGGASTGAETITLHHTAEWDQDAPYNILCPMSGSRKTITGCVATAMAIVLRYHQYPEHGTGVIPAYTANRVKVPENDTREHYYDWENMPLVHDGSWTDEQKKQVAQLMFDCGSGVKMFYGPDGSGAYAKDVTNALISYFGYDASCQCISAYAYSTTEWIETLKSELDHVGPICYSARDSKTGGHEFVIDGYDSNDALHINFGWSGECNGFYSFPNFNPDTYRFTERHNALFGMKPDRGSIFEDYVWLEKSSEANVISASTSNFSPDKSFKVQLGYVYWSTRIGTDFTLAIAHADKDGVIKNIVSAPLEVKDMGINEYLTSPSFTCAITSPIEEGDQLFAAYKVPEKEWRRLTARKDNKTNSVIFMTDTSIDARTSINYYSASGTIIISTHPDAGYTLTDSKGHSYMRFVRSNSGVLSIKTAELPPGEYKLRLSLNGQSKTFSFITGD